LPGTADLAADVPAGRDPGLICRPPELPATPGALTGPDFGTERPSSVSGTGAPPAVEEEPGSCPAEGVPGADPAAFGGGKGA
jgi:hypothetical protein